MKSLLLCVFAASAFVLVSATTPDICGMDEDTLAFEMQCIRSKAWLMLRNALNKLENIYQCTTDVCSFQRICKQGDIEDTLKKYVKPRPLKDFWAIAKKCSGTLPPTKAPEMY
ncbi:unnamed protein product [Ixodes pacificus]